MECTCGHALIAWRTVYTPVPKEGELYGSYFYVVEGTVTPSLEGVEINQERRYWAANVDGVHDLVLHSYGQHYHDIIFEDLTTGKTRRKASNPHVFTPGSDRFPWPRKPGDE